MRSLVNRWAEPIEDSEKVVPHQVFSPLGIDSRQFADFIANKEPALEFATS